MWLNFGVNFFCNMHTKIQYVQPQFQWSCQKIKFIHLNIKYFIFVRYLIEYRLEDSQIIVYKSSTPISLELGLHVICMTMRHVLRWLMTFQNNMETICLMNHPNNLFSQKEKTYWRHEIYILQVTEAPSVTIWNFGGSYLWKHWSNWPNIWDTVLFCGIMVDKIHE